MTSDNQDVAIFNKDKQLVLTTDKSVANFKTGTVGKIKSTVHLLLQVTIQRRKFTPKTQKKLLAM